MQSIYLVLYQYQSCLNPFSTIHIPLYVASVIVCRYLFDARWYFFSSFHNELLLQTTTNTNDIWFGYMLFMIYKIWSSSYSCMPRHISVSCFVFFCQLVPFEQFTRVRYVYSLLICKSVVIFFRIHTQRWFFLTSIQTQRMWVVFGRCL